MPQSFPNFKNTSERKFFNYALNSSSTDWFVYKEYPNGQPHSP